MTDRALDKVERTPGILNAVRIAVVLLLAAAAGWALLPHHGRQWTEAHFGRQGAWVSGEPLPQLSVIHFDPEKAVVPSNEELGLDPVADALRNDPHLRLRMEGYVAPVGAGQPKEDLRAERAQCVAEYLEGRGVNEDQITGSGFGDLSPLPSHLIGDHMADFARVELFHVP